MRSGTFGLAYWKPRSQMNESIIQSISIQDDKPDGMLITTNLLEKNQDINYDIMALTYSYGIHMEL